MLELHKLRAWRSQEFGRVPGNPQQECSDREKEGKPRSLCVCCWENSLCLCPGPIPSCHPTMPQASEPLLALSWCLSLHIIILVCVLLTLLFFLHQCELHEHRACVCSVYSFIPSAYPLVGSEVILEWLRLKLNWGDQEVQKKVCIKSNPHGEVSLFSKCLRRSR